MNESMNILKPKINKFHVLEDVEGYQKSKNEGNIISDEALGRYWESIERENEKLEPMEIQRIKKILGIE